MIPFRKMRGQDHGSMEQLDGRVRGSGRKRHSDTSAGAATAIPAAATTTATTATTESTAATATNRHASKEHRPISDDRFGRRGQMPSKRQRERHNRSRRAG